MAATRELARETWAEYFDALSKELLNAPVSIEVVTTPGLPVVGAAHLSLLALSYDPRDDTFEVAAARSATGSPSVVRHLVDHPEGVSVDSRTMLAPMTIAVDGTDHVRTVITIQRQPEISG